MSVLENDDVDQVVDDVVLDNEVEKEEEIIVNANNSTESNEDEEEPVISQDSEEDVEEDRVVTIGEPEPTPEGEVEDEPETPKWVKTVRKSNRRLESENKRLKRQLEELNKPVKEEVKLGEKPSLAACGYDDAKYEQELLGYYERKKEVEKQEVKKKEEAENLTKKWQGRQEKYTTLRKEHGFKDFQDAEEIVSDTLNTAQQSIIVQGAEDSALVVYALGKNPKKLEELSKLTDPVEFAFKVAKLESQLNVTNRKAPKPEKRIKSGKAGGVSGNGDATLARLREEAARTGNYTKVTAYKRKLRE